MRSLFFRIFLSFWLMMTAIGVAFAVIYFLAAGDERRERRAFLDDIVRTQGELAIYRSEAGRTSEAERALARMKEKLGIEIHVLGPGTRTLGGAPPLALARHARRLGETRGPLVDEAGDGELVALREGPAVVVARVPHEPKLRRERDTSTLPFRLLTVFLVSGLASYALARYLTRPLGELREAAQRFAEGDLSVRVSRELGGAAGEIVALGHDFDRMAERIEQLLATQKRLLRDVSHELRSPLARLSVALELARTRDGDSIAGPLDRIALESERLSDLIGQILTVTRLEDAGAVRGESVDVAALLEEVVRDARFEAQAGGVSLAIEEPGEVFGDPVSLRRAFENVVRNAVRLTDAGTDVEVVLARTPGTSDGVRVSVRDHGPGVPEAELAKIFEPFYRVDSSRNRTTGGAGIGLTIAELAVRLHRGAIRAENADGGGLAVVLDFPRTGLQPVEAGAERT